MFGVGYAEYHTCNKSISLVNEVEIMVLVARDSSTEQCGFTIYLKPSARLNCFLSAV